MENDTQVYQQHEKGITTGLLNRRIIKLQLVRKGWFKETSISCVDGKNDDIRRYIQDFVGSLIC